MAEWKATVAPPPKPAPGTVATLAPSPLRKEGERQSRNVADNGGMFRLYLKERREPPLRGRWTMANGKLLKQLIRSGAEGDLGAFRGVARRMIDEEHQKQHHLLANDLEIILDGRSRSCAPTASSPPSSARPPPTCAGSAGHDLRR